MRWADAILAAVLACSAAPLRAEFVSDPSMCAGDPAAALDLGVVLDADGMWSIEYTCVWEPPLDLAVQDVQVRPGYCSEPGFLFPLVFAMQIDGPRLLLWEGAGGVPQVFARCE